MSMKFHHAAALALVGWYLMIPPWSGPGRFDDKAPMRDWRQVGTYDSASECERDRNETADALLKNKDKGPDPETNNYNGTLYSSGRCVSTDDPRLKEK